MDEYLFRHFVDNCREVEEATSYVEILNYSVSGRPPSWRLSLCSQNLG